MKRYIQLNHLLGRTLFLLLAGSMANADSVFFELDFNAGYNNNVFLESDDLIVNEAQANASKTDVQRQLAVTGNWEFWDKESSDGAIMLDYFNETLTDNDASTRVLTLSIPVHIYDGDYRYGATLTRQAYQLSGVDVLDYTIAKLSMAKHVAGGKMYFDYSHTEKTPQDDSYLDYEGSTNSAGLKYKHEMNRGYLALHGNVFRNEYQADDLSNRGAYIKATYLLRFGQYKMSVAAKLKATGYKKDSLTDDERSDQQASVALSNEYSMSSKVQLYIESSYINNASNIQYEDENHNYEQWVNSLGARFTF